jgi:hypothetical protein
LPNRVGEIELLAADPEHKAVAISNQKPDGTVMGADEHRFKCRPPRTYAHRWQPGDVVIWDSDLGQPLRAAPGSALRLQRGARHASHVCRGDPATEFAPTHQDARANAFEPSTSNR